LALENQVEQGIVLSSSLMDAAGSSVIPCPLTSITEYRAVSFSPSGRFLILACSSDIQVLTRD